MYGPSGRERIQKRCKILREAENLVLRRRGRREEREDIFVEKNWLELFLGILYKMVGVSRDSVLNVNSGQHAVNVPIILTSGSNLSLRDVDIMST